MTHSLEDSRSPALMVVVSAKKKPIKVAPIANPIQALGEKDSPTRNGRSNITIPGSHTFEFVFKLVCI